MGWGECPNCFHLCHHHWWQFGNLKIIILMGWGEYPYCFHLCHHHWWEFGNLKNIIQVHLKPLTSHGMNGNTVCIAALAMVSALVSLIGNGLDSSQWFTAARTDEIILEASSHALCLQSTSIGEECKSMRWHVQWPMWWAASHKNDAYACPYKSDP